jgi:prepilin-type N-terminal cleavage/methylation domain-containing protein
MTRPVAVSATFSHPRAGVTLIEILIAVSLLSLLSVGMLVAMRIGFNTMEKVDSRLVSDRRVSYARRIIENEIVGYTYTLADWQVRPNVFQSIPFYQWEGQTMRFVTSYSLQDAWRGRPQIAALQVIPGEDGQGVRLIVNETPYTGAVQAGQTIASIQPDSTIRFVPVVANPQSFVLADRLAYCRFTYLEPRLAPPFQVWRPDWVLTQQLPQGIRIDMAPLDISSADLHVSTVTVALHVNRTPGAVYADAP